MDKQRLREEAAALVAQSGVPVTQVEPGFRSLQRAAKPKAQVGRPKEEGERYPSGKLKPKASIEPIAPALWDRLKTEAVKAVEDVRFGTEIGRLSIHGELSSTQASAGFRVAEVYGRFERHKRMRRSAASPSYLVASSSFAEEKAIEAITEQTLARATVEEMLTPEQLQELEAHIRASEKRFEKLQKFLRVYPSNVRVAMEMLCVDDNHANPAMLNDLRTLLDELAVFFRIKAAPKEKKRQVREVRAEKDGSKTEIPNVDKAVWLKHLAAMLPQHKPYELEALYSKVQVLKDREHIDRERAAQEGKPVYLHPRDAEFRKPVAFRRKLD